MAPPGTPRQAQPSRPRTPVDFPYVRQSASQLMTYTMNPVSLAELEAVLAPRQLDPSMAVIDPDPVSWVEFLEDENLRLTEELAAAHARLRAVMTACFVG